MQHHENRQKDNFSVYVKLSIIAIMLSARLCEVISMSPSETCSIEEGSAIIDFP
jgi:hypothetical protein